MSRTKVHFTEEVTDESDYGQLRANLLSVLQSRALSIMGKNPSIFFDVFSLTNFLLLNVASGDSLTGLKDHSIRQRSLKFTARGLKSVDLGLKVWTKAKLRAELREIAEEILLGKDHGRITSRATFELAAANALIHFNREKYESMQSLGKSVGRRKSYTREDYLATLTMNVTAASKALNMSRPTVYKMREEFAGLVDMSTGTVEEVWYVERSEEVATGSDRGGSTPIDESTWFSAPLGAETGYASDVGWHVLQ